MGIVYISLSLSYVCVFTHTHTTRGISVVQPLERDTNEIPVVDMT